MSIMNNESNGEGKRDGDDQLPDHLAPKQRELFMRIQGQQKDNKPGHEGGDKDYGGTWPEIMHSAQTILEKLFNIINMVEYLL